MAAAARERAQEQQQQQQEGQQQEGRQQPRQQQQPQRGPAGQEGEAAGPQQQQGRQGRRHRRASGRSEAASEAAEEAELPAPPALALPPAEVQAMCARSRPTAELLAADDVWCMSRCVGGDGRAAARSGILAWGSQVACCLADNGTDALEPGSVGDAIILCVSSPGP